MNKWILFAVMELLIILLLGVSKIIDHHFPLNLSLGFIGEILGFSVCIMLLGVVACGIIWVPLRLFVGERRMPKLQYVYAGVTIVVAILLLIANVGSLVDSNKQDVAKQKTTTNPFDQFDNKSSTDQHPSNTPDQKNVDKKVADVHFGKIRSSIPDFDQIIKTGEVPLWIDKQSSPNREQYLRIFKSGTAIEVIGLLRAYKDSTAGVISEKEAMAPPSPPSPSPDSQGRTFEEIMVKNTSRTLKNAEIIKRGIFVCPSIAL